MPFFGALCAAWSVREVNRPWQGVTASPNHGVQQHPTMGCISEYCLWPAAAASGGEARRTTPADVFLLSALAKLGATVVTYPLLLVKARLQSAGKHTADDRRYTGTLDAIERIYKTEGAPPTQFKNPKLTPVRVACFPQHSRLRQGAPPEVLRGDSCMLQSTLSSPQPACRRKCRVAASERAGAGSEHALPVTKRVFAPCV